jgi:hypothetical protein
LGVKRGGARGRSWILRKILGDPNDEKAVIEKAEAAKAEAEKRKNIIMLLARLVINNLPDDEKRELCSNYDNQEALVRKQNNKLKDIHSNWLMVDQTTNEYVYKFEDTELLRTIIMELKSKANIDFVDLNYRTNTTLYSDVFFLRGLGLISVGRLNNQEEINTLLYTMLAVCIEYLKRKRIVVYDFIPVECPPM